MKVFKKVHGLKPRTLMQRVHEILAEHNYKKTRKSGHASNQTQKDRGMRILQCFRELTHDLGFRLEEPRNLKPHHVERLVQLWVHSGQAPSTIANKISALRAFSEWINKKGMVKTMSKYCPDLRRQYAASHDRSPSHIGVDFWEVFARVYAEDKYVAYQLLLCKAFGARVKEAVMFAPLLRDKGSYIELFDGTKNGKPRTVLVDSEFKAYVVQLLKNRVLQSTRSVKGHIGNPNKGFTQNKDRFHNVLKKVGITIKDLGFTAHSLRQEYLNDQLSALGVIPPIRSGDGKFHFPPANENGPTGGSPPSSTGELLASKLDTSVARVSEIVGEAYVGGERSRAGQHSSSVAVPVTRPGRPNTRQCEGQAPSGEVTDKASGTTVPGNLAAKLPEPMRRLMAGVELPASMSQKQVEKILTDVAYLHVSEQAGHHRKGVMPAYGGALLVRKGKPGIRTR